MLESAGLETIFSRIEARKRLSKHDLQTWVAAVRPQQVTTATGDRSVVIIGANAEAIRDW